MLKSCRLLLLGVLIAGLSCCWLGCSGQSPPQKPAETAKAEKPPAELEQIKKSLGELGTMLEKRRAPEVEVKLTAAGEGEQGKGDASGQSGGQSPGGGQSQGPSGETSGGAGGTPAEEWREEMQVVRTLHREWNALEPEAVTKGMTTPTQAALEKNLCDLTRAVENRRALEAQVAANQVYRYYIEVAALFKTGIPANLERVRYHVMEARLETARGAWDAAGAEAGQALEIWRRLSYSLNQVERRTLNQVEHSLADQVNVIREQSALLTSIKTEVALQNLDKLAKEIKGSKGGE